MIMSVFDIITEPDIYRVHGYANFGETTPRQVVNDGVLKYSMGYSTGATAISILREHGLITKPARGGYNSSLTEKGKKYLRAMYVGRFSEILSYSDGYGDN